MTHTRTLIDSLYGAHDDTNTECEGTLCPVCECCMHCEGCFTCECSDPGCGCGL